MYIYNLFVSLWIVVVVAVVVYIGIVVGAFAISNWIFGYEKDKYIRWTIALPLTLLSYVVAAIYKTIMFPRMYRNMRLLYENFGITIDATVNKDNQQKVTEKLSQLAWLFDIECKEQERLRNQGEEEEAKKHQTLVDYSKRKFWEAHDLARNNKFAVPVSFNELLAR